MIFPAAAYCLGETKQGGMQKMSKQDIPLTVIRVFTGDRTAEELTADLIRAHEG